MKVLNFGSLNIDYTYSVPHIIVGGETMASSELHEYCGGKGLNQSIALARAGLDVWHAGTIGHDGDLLTDACREAGIHTEFIRKLDVRSGHTVIQVDENGQNSIILYGGTNMMQTEEYVDEVLAHFEAGDYLVLQNEINLLDYIIDKAYEKGMKIERFTSHSFRHSFATMAVNQGMQPQTLQKILGHSTITMTMDLYYHSSEEQKQEEASRIEIPV